MLTRILGTGGPALTEIGFGAWAIGGPWRFGWGPQNDSDSIAAIQAALEGGVNWIDTAAIYGLGHSEEIVGKAIHGKRDKVFVATKCGLIWDNKSKVNNNIQPDSIMKEAEASLRRLGTDYIDLYQIHWPDRKTPEDRAWEAMLKLKASGKIRYAGVSNFDRNKLELCLAKGRIDSLQPPYNLVKRKAELAELPFCAEKGIGVVAYSPMMSGLLSGSFDRSRLTRDDWRTDSPYFNEPFYGKARSLIAKLEPIARKYGKSVGQLSIAWVLANNAITSAIVGARNPGQVQEILGGTGWKIDPEDLNEIDRLSKEIIGEDLFKNL
jgi:aryl-alcohol dehydrogenase-like predicted oxidoreductase